MGWAGARGDTAKAGSENRGRAVGAMHRVVICDDHRLFAEALGQVLTARNYDVAACAHEPEAGVEAVKAHQPDVFITDLYFPAAAEGLSWVAAARKASPQTRVLVLSGSTEPQVLERSRESGAAGFLGKHMDLERIVQAISAVAQGEEVFYNTTGASREDEGAERAQDVMKFLTPREHEVLERLVSGQDTAALARDMGVAYSTARTHIQNLLAKLGVHSKLEAVALVARQAPLSESSTV